MSDKGLNITNKTEIVPDAVTLFVNGKIYEGWEDLQVTRELNSAASDFQLKFVDRWQADQIPWRIQPGDSVHIHAGKKSILTGYVDEFSASIASNARSLTVSGRSKTCDLVDCSVTGANEFSSLTIKELAEKVCQPFGVKVVMKGDPGAPFDKITVQSSETVFALIDRLARLRKLVLYPSPDGNLVLDKAGSVRARAELRQGQNMLKGKATFNNSNRFSTYSVKGQNLAWLGEAAQNIAPINEAKDEGITRFRPFIILAENTVDDQTSENRAAYEKGTRLAKSLDVEIEVQGWFQPDGTLWDINERIFVDVGYLGVRREMLCKKVTLQKNNGGTTATLSLTRKDAFDFNKNTKKDNPLGWTKFLKETKK